MSSFSFLSGYAGVVAVMCITAALNVHKHPKFRTEAFLARPPEAQRRSIRIMRILCLVPAVLFMGAAFGIGFMQGYANSKTEVSAVQNLFQSLRSESEAADKALVSFEESLQPAADDKLLSPEGAAAARKQLAEWDAAVSRWENGKKELVARTETAISKLDIRQSEREEILGGFHREVTTVEPMRDDYVRAKREVMVALGQKIDLLQARRGQIKLNKSGELVFSNAADARLSDAIDARIEAAAKHEEAAARSMTDRAVATQEKAKQVMGK